MKLEHLSFEDCGDYCHVRFTGPFEFESLEQARTIIQSHALQSGHNRLLFDLTASHGDLDVLPRFELAKNMAEQWGSAIRVAVLGRADQMLPDHFWETAAKNRGVPARVFRVCQEAVDWLRS
jgi:hypothetical protein